MASISTDIGYEHTRILLKEIDYKLHQVVSPLEKRLVALEAAARGERKAEYREMILGTLGRDFDTQKANEMLAWLQAGEEVNNG